MIKRKEASLKTRLALWAKSAGRCQYPGCNLPLWEDLLSGKEDGNFGFVAHIVASRPTGPRGHETLSAQLADDISNLMLLCHTHHKLIDSEDFDSHPIDLLISYKREHEKRVIHQASIHPNRATTILLYGADIAKRSSALSLAETQGAVLPERYPAVSHPIELTLGTTDIGDDQDRYWDFQKEHLLSGYAEQVRPRLRSDPGQHISVFSLAPQPLLIQLGVLLTDIRSVEVFQRHREPQTWKWRNHRADLGFKIRSEPDKTKTPVLIFSISADISRDRITDVLGEDISAWIVTIDQPNNDCIRSTMHLSEFRNVARQALQDIRSIHGENAIINVFPAMPVSCAVEFGRVWMPKADLPMIIFDQNRTVGGFIKTITIE